MFIFGEIDAVTNLCDKGFKLLKIFRKKNNKCEDYFYDEYNKKIYVRKNGDGLIVSSCVLKVSDPIKTQYLIRTFDISDAKKNSEFDSFDKMKTNSIENIFSEFGFWYSSENNIITDVEEFYDSSDMLRRDDKKYLSVRFIIDTTKLVQGIPYKIVYACSIPGMFPISDGRFDMSSQDRSKYIDFRSYTSALHMGHHLRFSAYFESGIDFKERPSGNVKLLSTVKKNKHNSTKTYNCTYKDNLFYQKYCFEVMNPQEFEEIYLKWNVKNPIQGKKI